MRFRLTLDVERYRKPEKAEPEHIDSLDASTESIAPPSTIGFAVQPPASPYGDDRSRRIGL